MWTGNTDVHDKQGEESRRESDVDRPNYQQRLFSSVSHSYHQ